MGFFARCKFLLQPRRRYTGKIWDNVNTPGSKAFLTPTTPISSTQAQENFFTPGPKLEPYLLSGGSKSPYREHSSPDTLQPVLPVRLPGKTSRTSRTSNVYDAGNPSVLRVPDQASQQYFNEKIPLPEFTTPAIFAHAVQCNIYPVQAGWEQAYVPSSGMRQNEVGTAPPTLLSRPIVAKTITGSVSGHRSPIKKVKAPARKRSGG